MLLTLAALLLWADPAWTEPGPQCPDGTEAYEETLASGELANGCRRDDGRLHGPYALVDGRGTAVQEAEYIEGFLRRKVSQDAEGRRHRYELEGDGSLRLTVFAAAGPVLWTLHHRALGEVEALRPGAPPPALSCPEGSQASQQPGEGVTQECLKPGLDGKPARHGPMRQWSREGQVVLEQEFRDGRPHGMRVSRHPNGRKKQEAFFDRDRLSGVRLTWSEDGSLAQEEWFVDGEPVTLTARLTDWRGAWSRLTTRVSESSWLATGRALLARLAGKPAASASAQAPAVRTAPLPDGGRVEREFVRGKLSKIRWLRADGSPLLEQTVDEYGGVTSVRFRDGKARSRSQLAQRETARHWALSETQDTLSESSTKESQGTTQVAEYDQGRLYHQFGLREGSRSGSDMYFGGGSLAPSPQ
ncbi:MAG: hypothetical protein HY554_12185 [Elusimicrobia bacterium]|nr:hypothetical protein [Elusimicrobiota bacterium]